MELPNENEFTGIQKILDFYPFQVSNIKLLNNKSGRTIWEVETDAGTKILKQANMKPRRMIFLAGAHIHLQNQGLPITPIHQTNNGGYCVGIDELSYVLYDKIDGGEVIYYNKEQLKKVMEFAGQFHSAAKGYKQDEESKTRTRLGKWHKLYRWKLQELEGNKQIALSYPNDAFSLLFLEHVDRILTRGQNALNQLDQSEYETWTLDTIASGVFCQQDFTLARFIDVEGTPFMKELHSITYDLPSRDLRVILNKVMKKLSVWDEELAIELLQSYDRVHPLTQKQYEVLWIDLAFPHLFCSIAHKYFLSQKKSWSDEKYIWALQNIIALENSKESFLNHSSDVIQRIKK